MLWACLHFPSLALETIARGDPGRVPLAIAAGETRPRVIARNAAAGRAGVRPGMAVAAALALAPGLEVHPRRPAAEAQALREIAQWALQFSPTLSIEGDAALLIEIGTGLKLFGGLEALLDAIRLQLPALGFSATLAAAPTPGAALMLARAGHAQALTERALLCEQLAPLPIAVTGCDEDSAQMLADLGVHTLGALLALPRDGLVRRFGQPLLATLDRALGRIPDPRPPFIAPEQFRARIELPAPAWEVEALLFAFKRLVAGASGWLRGRGLGAMRLRLELVHEACPPSALTLNLSTPSRDATHLGALVRERLERTQLPDRVEAITLSTETTAALSAQDRSLFPAIEPAEEAQLIERLCARLGDEAVCAVRPRADHRPEMAWRAARPAASSPGLMPPGPRPLWLLDEPQPLRQFLRATQGMITGPSPVVAPVVLMDGPERIESGWWEGRDVRRDYFVARAQSGQTLWIFNQPGGDEADWHVHGIFS
jgi:protein ImuB